MDSIIQSHTLSRDSTVQPHMSSQDSNALSHNELSRNLKKQLIQQDDIALIYMPISEKNRQNVWYFIAKELEDYKLVKLSNIKYIDKRYNFIETKFNMDPGNIEYNCLEKLVECRQYLLNLYKTIYSANL